MLFPAYERDPEWFARGQDVEIDVRRVTAVSQTRGTRRTQEDTLWGFLEARRFGLKSLGRVALLGRGGGLEDNSAGPIAPFPNHRGH